MFAAKRAGLMGEMPPEKIAAHGLDKLGLGGHPALQDVVASVLHLSFGAAAGAAFAGADYRFSPPVPAPLKGLLFGAAVWGIGYAGWVPAVGIMAMPDRDRRGRPESMLGAHLVYGMALVAILQLLHPPRRAESNQKTLASADPNLEYAGGTSQSAADDSDSKNDLEKGA